MKKEKISPFTNLGASNHSEKERQTDDFYSSPAVAINELNKKLIKYNINLSSTIVEPGVGSGGIVKPLKQIYPYKNYICFDIVRQRVSKYNRSRFFGSNKRTNK